MRNVIAKTAGVILLVQGFLLLFSGDVDARLRKKVSVEPFQNPAGWKGAFDPGAALAEMIKKAVIRNEDLRFIPQPSRKDLKPEEGRGSDGMAETASASAEKMNSPSPKETRYPAQIVIQGKILTINPNTAISSGASKNSAEFVREQAEVELELSLFNPRNKRIVARKIIRAVSMEGRKPFNISDGDWNSSSFRESSMGLALENLTKNSLSFLHETSDASPLDADIVEIDEKNGDVIINAGAKDGVELRDLFAVYQVRLNYADPITQSDLGEHFVPRGVIKVKNVQDNHSVAEVVAGSDLEAGSLAQSKRITPPLEAPPWWDFRGKLVLPNDYPVILDEYK